jgi:hypothetical protein
MKLKKLELSGFGFKRNQKYSTVYYVDEKSNRQGAERITWEDGKSYCHYYIDDALVSHEVGKKHIIKLRYEQVEEG